MAEEQSSQFFPVFLGGEAGGTEGKRWVETGGSGGVGEESGWGRGWLRNSSGRLAGGQVDGLCRLGEG